jgi:hypothetical protein
MDVDREQLDKSVTMAQRALGLQITSLQTLRLHANKLKRPQTADKGYFSTLELGWEQTVHRRKKCNSTSKVAQSRELLKTNPK